MAKDRQLRINETVDNLVGRVPGGERNSVRLFLQHWIANTYGGPGPGQDLFSDLLSTDSIWFRGNLETRAARRALMILRCEMLANGQPLRLQVNQVRAMPSGQVAAAVDAMMPAFRLYAGQEEGVNNALQIKLASLRANPQTFLQNNLVVTQSAPSPTGDGVGGATQYRFFYHYASQSYLLIPVAAHKPNGVRGDGIVLTVVNVPEVYWFSVPGRGNVPGAGNFNQIRSTELTGADMMVTSAFTGCSFCFKENGGTVYAAHISPDGTAANAGPNIGPAPTLATQLIATGNFAVPVGAQPGALQVFGRGLSNVVGHLGGYAVNALPGLPLVQASMYILGTRANGTWRLSFQENNGGARHVGHLL